MSCLSRSRCAVVTAVGMLAGCSAPSPSECNPANRNPIAIARCSSNGGGGYARREAIYRQEGQAEEARYREAMAERKILVAQMRYAQAEIARTEAEIVALERDLAPLRASEASVNNRVAANSVEAPVIIETFWRLHNRLTELDRLPIPAECASFRTDPRWVPLIDEVRKLAKLIESKDISKQGEAVLVLVGWLSKHPAVKVLSILVGAKSVIEASLLTIDKMPSGLLRC